MEWLNKNGYSNDDSSYFSRFGTQASYGGRSSPDQLILRTPVVFIHGNSDGALAAEQRPETEQWNKGWSSSIQHFLRNGYTSAELYAITYGDRQLEKAREK